MNCALNSFAERHCWESNKSQDFSGTKLSILAINKIIEIINQNDVISNSKEGYAPFCRIYKITKDMILEIGNILMAYVKREDIVAGAIQSGYVARRESELPVLTEWVYSCDVLKNIYADYLNIILYSREQLLKESEACSTADWEIVSINAETNAGESPMTPATMIRNALGVEYGGSGVKLDKEAYLKSVEFWSKHVAVLRSKHVAVL